jgi:hypothetical protein
VATTGHRLPTSLVTGPASPDGIERHVLERVEQGRDRPPLLDIAPGEGLAYHDVAGVDLSRLLEESCQCLDPAMDAPGMIDDQRRVEQVSHLHRIAHAVAAGTLPAATMAAPRSRSVTR